MTAPVLYSVHFGGAHYARLARVLEATARAHCPGWDVEVQETPKPARLGRGAEDSAVANHAKLVLWAQRVSDARDGDRVLLIDADTFVTAALDPLWETDFDVAITARPAGFAYSLNGGVVAVRVSPATREFMAAWLAVDEIFLRDSEARRPWRARYGGQNQASMGYLLESARPAELGVHVRSLPCSEWNCEDSTWAVFSPATRIVHVKSGLRLAALGEGGGYTATRGIRELAQAWRTAETTAYNRGEYGSIHS